MFRGEAVRAGAVLFFAAAAALMVFLGFEYRHVGHAGFPLDDTWIHFQLARNLSLGQGMVFNPGEPVSASSAPLWTLAIAGLHFISTDPVVGVKIFGSVLLWLTGMFTWGIARTTGLGRWWSVLCGMSVVVTPRLVWGALSGMEICLYTALATGGVWVHLATWNRRQLSLWVAILFALAALARPECLLLFPLALWDRARVISRDILNHVKWPIILYCCLLAPWIVFNLWVSGKPLPSTYYAKVGDYGALGAAMNLDFSQLAKTLLYYPLIQCQELIRLAAQDNLLLACAALLGLATMVSNRDRGRMSLFIPLVLVLFPVIRGIIAPFKGPLFQHGRYVAHMVPLLVVVGALGLQRALEFVHSSAPVRKGLLEARSAIVWGLTIAVSAVGVSQYGKLYALNVAEIEEMHIDMARWVAANTPPESVIASHDVGALGYFSGRKVLDTVGLVTPGVIEYLRPGVPADDGVRQYLQMAKPDYVIMMPSWYPRLTKMRAILRPVHEEAVRGVRTIAAGDRLVAYRATWNAR